MLRLELIYMLKKEAEMKSKIFTTISFLTFVILTFSSVTLSKDETVQSVWAASPVTVDGSNADWQADKMNVMKDFGIDYAFKNDGKYLYVLFNFKDKNFMSTFLVTGLTLWFNTEGSDKKTYGINFKERKVSADELIAILEKQQGPLPDARKAQFKSRPSYILCQGEFIDKKGNNLTATALGGDMDVPIFRLVLGRGTALYEIALRLNGLEKLAPELKLEPGKVVKIGFEWGGMTKEILQAKTGQFSTQSTRATQGQTEVAADSGKAEEMQEKMGHDSGPDFSSIRKGTEKRSFWVDVQLAKGQ
jgi:hypothetical protein